MPGEPPLSPEAVLDFVQAMGAQTSDSEGQRQLAGWVQKKFDEFVSDPNLDEPSRAYVREVVLIAASAIRGFAVERTAFKSSRAREQRIEEFRQRLLEPRFFFSAVGGERMNLIYAIALKVLGPVVLASALPALRAAGTGAQVAAVLAGVLWVMFGDLLTAMAVVRIQERVFRRTGDPRADVETKWRESVLRYKALAVDVLVNVDRARERHFENATPLLPGVRWRDVPPGQLEEFLRAPHPELGRSPLDVLSAIVDLHFSLDAGRYVERANRQAVKA